MAYPEHQKRQLTVTAEVRGLLQACRGYSAARRSFLQHLGVAQSNRDPLAEFSEVLVASLVGGKLAANRVQKDWDVEDPDGQRIQVKYLANPAHGKWPNEHLVRRLEQADAYALVIFENLQPTVVHLFPVDLSPVCAALGKRHAHQDRELQFTRANHLAIIRDPERFRELGMQVLVILCAEETLPRGEADEG